ncbi:DUF4870 domain-containing protein [Salibacterium sp. K-3]
MSSSIPTQDRLTAAAIYAVTLLLPLPLLTILIAYILYRMLRHTSSFVEKHAAQNVNLTASIHIYVIGLALLQFAASSIGEWPGWLPDQLAVLQVLFALGGMLSVFFIGMALLLLTALLIVLIVFALTGQWHRVPLLIRFIK